MGVLEIIEDVLGVHPKADFGPNADLDTKVRLVLAGAAHDVLSLVAPEVADAEKVAQDVADALKAAFDSAMKPVEQPAPSEAPAPSAPKTPAPAQPATVPSAGAQAPAPTPDQPAPSAGTSPLP